MINYSILHDSIEFYKTKNYKRIETPWTVSMHVDGLTRPDFLVPIRTNLKSTDQFEDCLVGSGEQSFLELIYHGNLPGTGKFQTITPCFRRDVISDIHQNHFMKNELIVLDEDEQNINNELLYKTMEEALEFFRLYIPKAKEIQINDHSWDIMYQNIELGSYGIRENRKVKYIFATGVAEPRLSFAKRIYELSHK